MQEGVEAGRFRRRPSGYGGRARIRKGWRLNGTGANLQVLLTKDEGGQGLKEPGINSGYNRWATRPKLTGFRIATKLNGSVTLVPPVTRQKSALPSPSQSANQRCPACAQICECKRSADLHVVDPGSRRKGTPDGAACGSGVYEATVIRLTVAVPIDPRRSARHSPVVDCADPDIGHSPSGRYGTLQIPTIWASSDLSAKVCLAVAVKVNHAAARGRAPISNGTNFF
jgi:hypothetical protein